MILDSFKQRVIKSRERIRKIGEKEAPVSATFKPIPSYEDQEGLPNQVVINTMIYDLWEDILILSRALGLEE